MPYSDQLRSQVLDAIRASGGISVQAIAKAYAVHHSTVTRWARKEKIALPTAEERIAFGGLEGGVRRWGDHEKRRKQARKLRAGGNSLEEIRLKLGYRSIAGASYAPRLPLVR